MCKMIFQQTLKSIIKESDIMKNINYYGATKEEYESCKTLRDSMNERNVKAISTVSGILELILGLISLVSPISGKYGYLYLIYGLLSSLLAISIRTKRFHPNPIIQIYILMLLSFSFGISITVPSAEDKAILFPLMLATLPFLFIDVAWRMLSFMGIVSALYCTIAFTVKTPEVAQADMYNIICFGIGALIIQYFVNKNVVLGFASRVKNEQLLIAYDKAQEELRIKACTDLMTGLYNRTYFTNEAVHFFELCQEVNDTGYLVMMDLDKFKRINDTFGHQTGDEVIIQVAQVISRHLKGEEYGARLGGDEYIFVLAERFHTNNIKEVILSILEDVHSIKLKDGECVSSSLGITLVSSSELVFDDMYRATDKALYQAKEKGGNQIVFGQMNIKALA